MILTLSLILTEDNEATNDESYLINEEFSDSSDLVRIEVNSCILKL